MGEKNKNSSLEAKCAEPGDEDSTCFYCLRTKKAIQGDVQTWYCGMRAFYAPHNFRPNFKAEMCIEELGL